MKTIYKCKKQTTIAIIIKDGKWVSVGTNGIKNKVSVCPREGMESGVGYELCKTVCGQYGHAEEIACIKAGENARGGTLYLTGHTYCCDNCKRIMEEYGIKEVIIV